MVPLLFAAHFAVGFGPSTPKVSFTLHGTTTVAYSVASGVETNAKLFFLEKGSPPLSTAIPVDVVANSSIMQSHI